MDDNFQIKFLEAVIITCWAIYSHINKVFVDKIVLNTNIIFYVIHRIGNDC